MVELIKLTEDDIVNAVSVYLALQSLELEELSISKNSFSEYSIKCEVSDCIEKLNLIKEKDLKNLERKYSISLLKNEMYNSLISNREI